jgi:hypothetical protein
VIDCTVMYTLQPKEVCELWMCLRLSGNVPRCELSAFVTQWLYNPSIHPILPHQNPVIYEYCSLIAFF